MVRRRSSNAVTVAAIAAALALCLHAAAAYPAPMERVLGDNNNYLPIRSSLSRDLDRFVGPPPCEDCAVASLPDGSAAAGSWEPRDRPPTASKRDDSLDRLEPGHLMTRKRDGRPSSSDTVDRLGMGGPLSARRRPSSRGDYVRLQHHRLADFVRRFADDSWDDSFYYFGAPPSFYE